MILKTLTTVLTDQSKVYDVVIRDEQGGQIYQIPCVSLDDADAFIRALAALVEAHTVETITVDCDDRCRPHAAFKYIRADEVAECWDGVGTELYTTLWNKIVPLQKAIPNREDTGPADHVGHEALAAHWHVLSLADQIELNALAAREERRMGFDSE